MSAQILYLHDQIPKEPEGNASGAEAAPGPQAAPVAGPVAAELIDAYWDDVLERVQYVMSLMGAGH